MSVYWQTLLGAGLIWGISLAALLLRDRSAARFLLRPATQIFGAGLIFGYALFHMLPESFHHGGDLEFVALLLAAAGFILPWRLHARAKRSENRKRPVSSRTTILFVLGSSALHKFIDGAAIAGAFAVNPAVGWTTAAAFGLHETPFEIGKLCVLQNNGLTYRSAATLNLLSASPVFFAPLFAYLFRLNVGEAGVYLLPFVAGTLVFIAWHELVSGKKNPARIARPAGAIFFACGLGLAAAFVLLTGHAH